MKAYVVTGLGYGDEGKGSITHWLACKHRAHTVIRTGGAQALHRVVSADKGEHVFSQFGSGTIRGAATHLSKHMVIDPHAILKEGEYLLYKIGIPSVFETMTVHEDALVITPFQAIAGRVRELLRGKKRLGSVGIGIGETVLDAEVIGEAAIRAKDLAKPSLREKLEVIQRRTWKEFEHLADRASEIPVEVEEKVRRELTQLESRETVAWALERFTELVKRVRVVDTDYVANEILGLEGTVIFEGSQGVLLDRLFGFHPYTTKVRTIPQTAMEIMDECGYRGERTSLGIIRAYHTRHGGGPFVSESAPLTKQLPDALNKFHIWQGNFRVGHFDAVLLRYAIAACGGAIDGLVVTCLDRVHKRDSWKVCDSYAVHPAPPEELFLLDRKKITDIKVERYPLVNEQLKRQEKIGQALYECMPVLTERRLPAAFRQKRLIKHYASAIEEFIPNSVPVVAMSMGETDNDKIEV